MNCTYEGIEVFYPNGRGGPVGWCFCYWHNGRLLRSIASFWSREEAKLAGRRFCGHDL